MKRNQIFRLLAECLETAIGCEDYGPVRAAKAYCDWYPSIIDDLRQAGSITRSFGQDHDFEAFYQVIYSNSVEGVKTLTGKSRDWWLSLLDKSEA